MKKYPIGLQSIKEILENEYLYIDKTRQIFNLLEGKYYFLSRPRRFGKSLLVSTLKEIFEGKKELFKEQWIYKSGYTWEKHPVVHLAFNNLGYREGVHTLAETLSIGLKEIARNFKIELRSRWVGGLLQELITALSSRNKVVILIDEYDKPIIDYLGAEVEQAKRNREVLRSFYSVLKELDDKLRFVFLTGVSKFSQTSIFSELNNLKDISIGGRYSTLLGITQGELEENFKEELEAMSFRERESLLQKMKYWYNGFSWDGKNFVYNPFSLLNIFEDYDFSNYWFETGTPTFLINLLKEKNYDLSRLSRKKIHINGLQSYDIEQLPPIPLMFQTGYVTIKERCGEHVVIDYPNYEVERSFVDWIAPAYTDSERGESYSLTLKLKEELENGDIDSFMSSIKAIFKGITYRQIEKKESYFHSVFYLIVKMLGFEIDCEILTSNGKIDAVITTKNYIYIIEFKLSTEKAAIAQIQERGYHIKYLNGTQKIVLVGIAFDAENRDIRSWLAEEQ